MARKVLINLATGLEDPERMTVASLCRCKFDGAGSYQ